MPTTNPPSAKEILLLTHFFLQMGELVKDDYSLIELPYLVYREKDISALQKLIETFPYVLRSEAESLGGKEAIMSKLDRMSYDEYELFGDILLSFSNTY